MGFIPQMSDYNGVLAARGLILFIETSPHPSPPAPYLYNANIKAMCTAHLLST